MDLRDYKLQRSIIRERIVPFRSHLCAFITTICFDSRGIWLKSCVVSGIKQKFNKHKWFHRLNKKQISWWSWTYSFIIYQLLHVVIIVSGDYIALVPAAPIHILFLAALGTVKAANNRSQCWLWNYLWSTPAVPGLSVSASQLLPLPELGLWEENPLAFSPDCRDKQDRQREGSARRHDVSLCRAGCVPTNLSHSGHIMYENTATT